jgi:hypothetical protein
MAEIVPMLSLPETVAMVGSDELHTTPDPPLTASGTVYFVVSSKPV